MKESLLEKYVKVESAHNIDSKVWVTDNCFDNKLKKTVLSFAALLISSGLYLESETFIGPCLPRLLSLFCAHSTPLWIFIVL